MLVKHLIANQKRNIGRNVDQPSSQIGIGYWRYYNELIPPQYFIEVVHF